MPDADVRVVSVDGPRIYVSDFDEWFAVWDTVQEESLQPVPQADGLGGIVTDVAGDRMAVLDSDHSRIVSADDQTVIELEGMYFGTFSPSGNQVVFSDRAGVRLWDVIGGSEIVLDLPASTRTDAVRWGADGALVLARTRVRMGSSTLPTPSPTTSARCLPARARACRQA